MIITNKESICKEIKKPEGIIFGIEDNPPFCVAFFAALQHLLAVFVGIITPPIIICSALGTSLEVKSFMISMALFASGVCTFIQCKRVGIVGAQLLCIQGTSFQFVAPLIAIGMYAQNMAKSNGLDVSDVVWGLPLIFGCCIMAAPAEMVAAFLFKKLRKIITPLISGIVVVLIGLELIKVAMVYCGGGYASMASGANYPFGCWQNLTVATIVLITIVFFNTFKNNYVRMSSVIIGIIVGYIIAWHFGMINFKLCSHALNIPVPFKWGLKFDLASIIELAIVYFITSIEANGDITANSMISGLSIDDDSYYTRIRGGILGDGVNSAIAGVFNSFPNSIFAQNTGLIQLTGIASRYIGYYIAVLLIFLGLFPIIGDIFATMPDTVLGGAMLLMFGMVAVSGIKIITSQYIGRKETLIIALSLGIGLGVDLCPEILNNVPESVKHIFSSGLVAGGIVAIISNLIIKIKE